MSNYAFAVIGLKGLSVPDKVEKGRWRSKLLALDPRLKDPLPTPAEVLTASETLADAFARAQHGSEEDTRVLHVAEEAFDLVMTRLWAYVQHISQGEADVIRAAGFAVKAPAIARGAPLAPTDLTSDYGTFAGEVKLRVRAEARANRTFVVRYRPEGAAEWTEMPVPFFTLSMLITGLTSGVRYEFEVAASTSAGRSPWSNIRTQMVP